MRDIKQKQITLISKATTTVTVKVTTAYEGSWVDTSGYITGVFLTDVRANTSLAPKVVLDISVDDKSTYGLYATLHNDMTTTANKVVTKIDFGATYIRARIPSLTTSFKCRLQVKAEVSP